MPRWLLTLVSFLAPASRRADWRDEWDSEFLHRADERNTAGASARDARRDTGRGLIAAASHALWLRRLEWSFIMNDARFALRLLGRQPGLAAVIIATLALGIGGATTMFSVVNGVLLRPLAYEEPGELVWMFGAFSANDSAAVSPPDFLDYRERNPVFSSLGAMMISPSGATVSGPEGPERLQASRVTAGLISTLGVSPALGRDFDRAEEALAGPQAVIISHRLWRDRFGAAPDVLGRAITIDQRVATVVGVMPPGFALPYDPYVTLAEPVDLYLPFPFDAPEAVVRRFHFLRLIGRLAPDVTLTQAQQQMDVIAAELEATYPENETWKLRLLPLHERLVGDVRPALMMLFGAVGLVLLIACGNVASLLLARATSRRDEIALRAALGASRGRIVRQLLVEGLVLSMAGAGAGVLLAWWGLGVLKQAGPATLPRLADASIDPMVVGFALLVAAGATLTFSLAPALQLATPAIGAALVGGTRNTQGRSRTRARQALVAVQVALSIVLLVRAGLLVRSFARLQAVDLGFATADVLLAPVSLPPQSYPSLDQAERFFTTLADDLQRLPGVEAAALATTPPLIGGNDTSVHREGRAPATPTDQQFAQIRWVQGRYFETLEIPVRAGRVFDDPRDAPGAPPVVVISQAMAETFFPGEAAIGQRVVVGLRTPLTAEVVGVVGDTLVFGQDSEAPALIYLSARQSPTNFMNAIVRMRPGVAAPDEAVRRAVQGIEPTLAMARLLRMDELSADAIAPARFRTGLVGSFAAVALALTVVGLYGALAYTVATRRREIGIRLALGARASEVVGLILRQGGRLIGIGIAMGLAAAFVASRWLTSMLFEVTPADPLVFTLVPAVLAIVAVAAIAIPARRAARVDPVGALRNS